MKRTFYQRGTSLPETVIVMGVLMFLLLGIIDFGRYLYTYSFVAQLARQGARWTIVRGTSCTVLSTCPGGAKKADVQTYVQSLSIGATVASNISVGVTSSTCTGNAPFAPGCTVTVSVSYPFNFMFPFLPTTQYTITSSSTMQQAN